MKNENNFISYLFSIFMDISSISDSPRLPHDFTDEELKMITTSRLVCSAISIFACTWIFIFYTIMCIKFRCTNRRTSVISKQSTDSTTDPELHASLVGKDPNNNEHVARKRYKSVFKHTRSSRNSDLNRNKMGIGNDLIFFLILSNLGWSFGTFFGMKGFNSPNEKYNPYCITQAFLQNYFDISSVCFTMLISRVTFLGTTKCYADLKKVKYRMCLFLLYGTICPLILTLGPYFTGSLGCSGGWCWLDFFNIDIYIYLWTISIYLFDLLNIMYIIYALFVSSQYFEKRKLEINCDLTKSRELNFLKKYVFILKSFPIILIINRLPGFLNRVYSLIRNKDSFCLFMMHCVTMSLSGLFNSLIYSYFYRSVWKCCCKRKDDYENLETDGRAETNGINNSS
jgi:hypothetical protein